MTRRLRGKEGKRTASMVTLTPQARAVLRAFVDARRLAPGFLLSCGLLPEVSESCSDRLFRIVHDIAGEQLDRRRHARALGGALRRASRSADDLDVLERHLTALQSSEATAAYVFGLSVGLAMSSMPDRLRVDTWP